MDIDLVPKEINLNIEIELQGGGKFLSYDYDTFTDFLDIIVNSNDTRSVKQSIMALFSSPELDGTTLYEPIANFDENTTLGIPPNQDTQYSLAVSNTYFANGTTRYSNNKKYYTALVTFLKKFPIVNSGDKVQNSLNRKRIYETLKDEDIQIFQEQFRTDGGGARSDGRSGGGGEGLRVRAALSGPDGAYSGSVAFRQEGAPQRGLTPEIVENINLQLSTIRARISQNVTYDNLNREFTELQSSLEIISSRVQNQVQRKQAADLINAIFPLDFKRGLYLELEKESFYRQIPLFADEEFLQKLSSIFSPQAIVSLRNVYARFAEADSTREEQPFLNEGRPTAPPETYAGYAVSLVRNLFGTPEPSPERPYYPLQATENPFSRSRRSAQALRAPQLQRAPEPLYQYPRAAPQEQQPQQLVMYRPPEEQQPGLIQQAQELFAEGGRQAREGYDRAAAAAARVRRGAEDAGAAAAAFAAEGRRRLGRGIGAVGDAAAAAAAAVGAVLAPPGAPAAREDDEEEEGNPNCSFKTNRAQLRADIPDDQREYRNNRIGLRFLISSYRPEPHARTDRYDNAIDATGNEFLNCLTPKEYEIFEGIREYYGMGRVEKQSRSLQDVQNYNKLLFRYENTSDWYKLMDKIGERSMQLGFAYYGPFDQRTNIQKYWILGNLLHSQGTRVKAWEMNNIVSELNRSGL